MVGMSGIVAPATSLAAILQTRGSSLQGIDHDRQARVGGPWTMADLTRDGDLGAHHWVIQVEKGRMAALASGLETLLLAQCGVRTGMRAQDPGREDGSVTSATRHAADCREPVRGWLLWQGIE
jgi:hypothetical protein